MPYGISVAAVIGNRRSEEPICSRIHAAVTAADAICQVTMRYTMQSRWSAVVGRQQPGERFRHPQIINAPSNRIAAPNAEISSAANTPEIPVAFTAWKSA